MARPKLRALAAVATEVGKDTLFLVDKALEVHHRLAQILHKLLRQRALSVLHPVDLRGPTDVHDVVVLIAGTRHRAFAGVFQLPQRLLEQLVLGDTGRRGGPLQLLGPPLLQLLGEELRLVLPGPVLP